MPQLGESITEGTINSWLVKEGDRVHKYDPVADIMTDKVNAEVPSFFSGVIKEIVTAEGETIGVGEVMCYIDTDGSQDENQNIDNHGDEVIMQRENKTEEEVKEVSQNDQSMRKRYSPAVLRLAQEHHIDLDSLEGTGRGGRITRKDVEAYIEKGVPSEAPITSKTIEEPVSRREEEPAATEEPTTSSIESVGIPSSKTEEVRTASGDIEIPVTGIRREVARNMVRSKNEIPHAWMTIEVDVTDLVAYRDEIKDEFRKKEGYNITYFSFFVKAVAQALNEHPRLNSTWAGDKIIQRNEINLSFAVAKENDLFVPVIRQADEKSIKGIAKEIYDLAIKARAGKLTAEDVDGGTFTINNAGSFGSIHSMGVINYPQAAILQIESIVKRPVIIDNMFAARDMVNLSLSLDHRILDGLICGRFMGRMKEILENINRDNTNVF